MVNLIRHARLGARIESKLGHVVMGSTAGSPHQQVIKKTKSHSFGSQMLAMNIEKKIRIAGQRLLTGQLRTQASIEEPYTKRKTYKRKVN